MASNPDLQAPEVDNNEEVHCGTFLWVVVNLVHGFVQNVKDDPLVVEGVSLAHRLP